MEWTIAVLVPLGVVVVLPVMIVWLIVRTISNRDNKNAEVLIKAIESNNTIDADKLAGALGKSQKTPAQILQARLLRGCISTFIGVGLIIYSLIEDTGAFITILISCITIAVGLAYLLVYFVTRKSVESADGK